MNRRQFIHTTLAATLVTSLRDDAKATAFLKANALEEGTFLCCFPPLRWTPYWEIRKTPMDARAEERHARNQAMADHDHAPLRAAITAVARETPLKRQRQTMRELRKHLRS